MNILYLCDEYPPGRHGGIGTAVQTLAREMVRQGHTVIVAGFYDWGYGGEDAFDDEGVKVYRFRRGLASSSLQKQDGMLVKAIYKFYKLTGAFQRDIEKSLPRYGNFLDGLIQQYGIQVVEMPDYNDYMRFCSRYVPFPTLSVPVIVKFHGSMTFIRVENNYPLPEQMRQMEHDILQQANAVCSVSKYAAVKTAEYLDYDGTVTVMHNGIEKPVIVNEPRDAKLVVYTGALTESKGIYQLMKAWNLVNQQMPEASLVLYGKGSVPKAKAYLTAAAAGTVQFTGHVPKQVVLQKLATTAVAVYPSFAETFGLAPIEAMACGAAVIYTNRTAGPEVINDKVDGRLIDPANEHDIADKILYLLKNDAERQSMALNGLEKVAREFDIEIVARKHADYYTRILNELSSVSL